MSQNLKVPKDKFEKVIKALLNTPADADGGDNRQAPAQSGREETRPKKRE